MARLPDFDERDLGWIDRLSRQIDDYVSGLEPPPMDAERLRSQLHSWSQFGFVIVPSAVEPELVDAMLADLRRLLDDHRRFNTVVEAEGYRCDPIRKLPSELIAKALTGEVHLRVMDLIHHSVAAKRISLHPNITEVLEHVLRDRVIAFQSLNFVRGSEQTIHQDYAYVPAVPRARLVASWVALEDVHPDSGPLRYIPGSHRIPKFDWGNGLYMVEGSARDAFEFEKHILEQAERAGLQIQTFCPRKGDAFLWHAALAHGGSPVVDPARTRKSYVTHYGASSSHVSHVHGAGRRTARVEYPGGFAFRHPLFPDEDDVFPYPAAAGS